MGRRGISNQMGSRRLHVENDMSSRSWENGGAGYTKKDPRDKRLKDEHYQDVVVKPDVEGKAKGKENDRTGNSSYKRKLEHKFSTESQ